MSGEVLTCNKVNSSCCWVLVLQLEVSLRRFSSLRSRLCQDPVINMGNMNMRGGLGDLGKELGERIGSGQEWNYKAGIEVRNGIQHAGIEVGNGIQYAGEGVGNGIKTGLLYISISLSIAFIISSTIKGYCQRNQQNHQLP